MKYIVMLGDGMADFPIEELGGKTPLEAAHKPFMDKIAREGRVGMVKTVPDGMPPQSDTANLSVMGYDPKIYYTGRSPLEAVSMGIELGEKDVAMRCNLVCISEEENYEDATMVDYSSDEISTEEARILIKYLDENLHTDEVNLYPGISYRHCLVLRNSHTGAILTPPHDISGKPVKEHLPKGEHAELLLGIMKRSYELLKDHPVNIERKKKGLKPANSCWFWGEGTRPALTSFEEKYGVKGGVVCAVDLIKGLGLCAKMAVPNVPGATGGMVTNYAGKGEAALKLLTEGGCDLVYIHVEAPDESGHRASLKHKISAIEHIDSDILGLLIPELEKRGEEFSVLLLPDHPTPLSLMTHIGDPVPFAIYSSSRGLTPHAAAYSERAAAETGIYEEKGCELMGKFIRGEF